MFYKSMVYTPPTWELRQIPTCMCQLMHPPLNKHTGNVSVTQHSLLLSVYIKKTVEFSHRPTIKSISFNLDFMYIYILNLLNKIQHFNLLKI